MKHERDKKSLLKVKLVEKWVCEMICFLDIVIFKHNYYISNWTLKAIK